MYCWSLLLQKNASLSLQPDNLLLQPGLKIFHRRNGPPSPEVLQYSEKEKQISTYNNLPLIMSVHL